MPIVIEDAQVERLAQQVACAEGVSVDEVLRKCLVSFAHSRGLLVPRAPLRERLAALAKEVDAVPPPTLVDTRSEEEILGYEGLW